MFDPFDFISDTFAQRRTSSGSILPRFAMTYMLCLVLVGCGTPPSKSVLTQHNDNARTGAYLSETALNPANVNKSTFGPLNYSFEVDGHILAQPLYVSGGVRARFSLVGRNALYIATLENKIYGFDADDGTPLWTDFPHGRKLGDGLGEPSPLPYSEWKWASCPSDWKAAKVICPQNAAPCGQTRGNVGIVSTPVIDRDSNTMYVVFRTGTPDATTRPSIPDNVQAHYWLAAIDITNGHYKGTSTPIEIKTDGFSANMELNRPGLLFANGVLYVAFGAPVCDHGGNPWLNSWEKPAPHGWVFAYNAANLTQVGSFNTSRYTGVAGIWQSGNGLSADSAGFVYALTGNNGTDVYPANDQCNNGDDGHHHPTCDNQSDKWIVANPQQKTELGNSVLKLHLDRTGDLDLDSYYTVGNWFRLDTGLHYPGEDSKGANVGDADLGSGGLVVLAKSGLLIGGGKQGRLYIFDPSHIEVGAKQAFQAFYNTWDSDIDPLDYDQNQQNGPNIHGGPAVWHPDGVNYTLVFEMPEKDYLKAYRAFDDGRVDEHPFLTTMEQGVRSPRGMPGGFSSVSANGGRDGIVWVSGVKQDEGDASTTSGGSQGRLMAFDALTLRLLWQSDDTVPFAKFVPPTIGGGKVFRVAYKDEVRVYGLKPGTVQNQQPVSPSIRPIDAQWWNTQDRPRLELFMTARDGTPVSIYWDQKCCGGWAGWFPVNPSETLPEVSAAASQPITAVWRPLKGPGDSAHLDVFLADKNGVIWSTSFDGQSLSWAKWFVVKGASDQAPPRAAPGQPVTAVWRPAKGPGEFRHLDLFITDENGVVQSTFFDEATPPWSKWFVVKDASGQVPPRAALGQPVTAVWRPAKGPGDFRHLDLFMTDEHGVVQSTFFDEECPPSYPRPCPAPPGPSVRRTWSKWFAVKDATGRAAPQAAPGQPVTAVWRPAKLPGDFRHLDLFMTDEHGVVQSTFFDEECPPSYPAPCTPSPGPSVPRTWSNWFVVKDAAGQVPPHAKAGQPVTALWRPAKVPGDLRHLDLFMTDEHGVVQTTFFDEEHPPSTNPSVSRSFVWFEVKSTPSEIPPHAVPGQPVTALWRANKDPKDPRHLDLFTYDNTGVVRSTFFDEERPPWVRWFPVH